MVENIANTESVVMGAASFNDRTPAAPSDTDPVERVTAAATPGTRSGPLEAVVTLTRTSSSVDVSGDCFSLDMSILSV